ncbi:MAG TPA: hypothetical protein VGN15_09720, partial [Ktedonobacteraceae bacterium]|nr:hypothetical protein [Ktedonobacteraceae bacterium]
GGGRGGLVLVLVEIAEPPPGQAQGPFIPTQPLLVPTHTLPPSLWGEMKRLSIFDEACFLARLSAILGYEVIQVDCERP